MNDQPSEETVASHLEEHREMFAEPSDDDVQTLTFRELRETLQAVFEQGILRGIVEGQDTVITMLRNDPEIDQSTVDYIESIVRGGTN